MKASELAGVAGFPMYDFPALTAAHDALWAALSARLAAAGVGNVPPRLTRDLAHRALWGHPALLLGQGCEYPLAKSFGGKVHLVATPRYAAEGCEAATYRSAIVVRNDDPAMALSDLRHRRCVVNERDSNSGMNLLRAAIAPLAGGASFFSGVTSSGSHLNSASQVSRAEADVAAIDCVSFAHFKRWYPAAVRGLRVLAWSPPSPCLPFVTARATDPNTLQSLRRSLADTLADPALANVCATLLLTGVDLEPDPRCCRVLALEQQARDRGYPELV